MAGRSLKPQLNQIRAWVRQGRTDAWIAHQLEVSPAQLQEFRKQNGLDADSLGDSPAEVDIRDEIEAEIEAELDEIEDLPEDEPVEKEEAVSAEKASSGEREPSQRQSSARRSGRGDDRQGSGSGRRRGKRGGRRRGKRGSKTLDATFEQGKDGYGLWLDPAIADEAIFTENWKGKRALRVTVEQGRIVLEPSSRD